MTVLSTHPDQRPVCRSLSTNSCVCHDLRAAHGQPDLERYTGRWYEISRLPMWFERNCTGDITATYTLRERINASMSLTGAAPKRVLFLPTALQKCPTPNILGSSAYALRLTGLAWLPAVWGDYWIMDLDPQYRWVMVGAPNRSYLWILSRTPALDANTVSSLKQKAAALGFNVDEMVNVTNAPQ